MKTKLFFAALFCFAVFSPPCVQAQTYGSDIAVRVDYFHFTDSQIKQLNAEDGVYVGLEAYKQLFAPNLFFGIAIGWAGTSGNVSGVVSNLGFLPTFVSADSSIDYVPIELNVKYVIPFATYFDFAFGAGGSINYFSLSTNVSAPAGVWHVSDSDWVWGGQFFGEINYRISNWFIGADVKYQFTQDLHLFGVDTQAGADNLRLGGHIGFSF